MREMSQISDYTLVAALWFVMNYLTINIKLYLTNVILFGILVTTKYKGGHKMADIKKIRKSAFALFVVVSLVLLWFIVSNVRNLFLSKAEWNMQWNVVSIVITFIGVLIILGALTTALFLLYSTKKDETPFSIMNVKRLKTMAILLVAFEPYTFAQQLIFSKLYPIVLADNTSITIHSSLGGFVLAAGLVVYCISLVFEYGISLQKQIDETL